MTEAKTEKCHQPVLRDTPRRSEFEMGEEDNIDRDMWEVVLVKIDLALSH